MNKFEQLIEYVINDEEAKARELFHELVIEKSRNIYEEMMSDEEIEIDEQDEEIEEGCDEMGGDQADDLIDDIETEESGISMEGDDDMDDMDGAIELDGDDEDSEEGLEDRVVDLEDKLDELMAEFEGMMGGDGDAADDMDMDSEDDMDMDSDDMDMDLDSEEVEDDEFETEGMRMSMEEAISLKAAPKPVTSEEGSINKRSAVAANSGARGALAKPVHATGTEAQGRPAPGTKDLVGKVGNTPAQSTQKPTPATKPHLAQASGVNTKSVIK
jgi:hypothetical protein